MRIPNERGEVGKYDAECEQVFQTTLANGVVLIVLGGEHGSGFSVTLRDPQLAYGLPDILESMAKSIRAQLHGQKNS